AEIRPHVHARSDAAPAAAVFLRHGGAGVVSHNLEDQGRAVFDSPFRGPRGVPEQEPDARTAAATGQATEAAEAEHRTRAIQQTSATAFRALRDDDLCRRVDRPSSQ